MISSKLDQRLERRLNDSSLNGELVPIKIIAEREYKEAVITEVSFAPNKPVRERQEVLIMPGLQALVNELEAQKIPYLPFMQSKTTPVPYIIAELNKAQIRDFAKKDYVHEMIDDSPMI